MAVTCVVPSGIPGSVKGGGDERKEKKEEISSFFFLSVCVCLFFLPPIGIDKDNVTSEKVRAKIQQATGPHEDLLTIVKRRRLQWYGNVSRSSGQIKTIL